MKIIVAGAGGVGAYIGARLQRDAGAEVWLVARGANLEALRTHGLRLTRNGATSVIRVSTINSTDPRELEQCRTADWVLFASKTQDTEALASRLAPLLAEQTRVCSLQNGVDNEPILQKITGKSPVGGICMGFGAHLTAPGEIEVSGRDGLIFGDYPTGSSARVEALATVCRQAGYEVRISTDIRRELWKKLIMNAGCNPLSALLDKNSRELVTDQHSARLVKNIMREAAYAAAADGVDFSAVDLEQMFQVFSQVDPLRSSMQVDAGRGTPLELSGITGAVLERAGALGLPVPVTSTIHDLLAARFHCA